MKVHEFMHEMATTSAIFGRKHGIHVEFKGDQAATDGDTIYLPALPLNQDLTPAQVRAMRGFVDHEAGHLRHSDMPRIMEFYDRCIHNGKGDLKDLHNCLEDIWMEDRVCDEYHGAYKNLAQTTELCKTKEIEAVEHYKEQGIDVFENTTVQNAGAAITTVGRTHYGSTANEKLMGMMPDKLKAHADKWCEEALKCENSEDVITLAKSVYKLLKEDDPNLDSNPEDFDPESGEGMDEGENSPDFTEGKKQKGNPFAGDADGDSEEGKGDGEPQWAESDSTDAINCEAGDGASGAIGGNNGDLRGKYRVYSTDRDKVYRRGKPMDKGGSKYAQKVVDSSNHSGYDRRKLEINGNIMVMKSKLKRALLAKQQRDWDSGRELGRLDSKRLVSAYTGSRTVFKQRTDREEHDTAVTVLIDLSGSMHGRKSDVTRDCVIALSECFEGSDIKYNVVGFCNKGRHPDDPPYRGYHRVEPLDTIVFKDFDTPLRTVRASINEIPDAVGGNNSDYDFIVNAINDLRSRDEKRKVLFVLSDGHPACYSGASTSELVRHCKQATIDAKKKGVECVGVGICDSAVTQIYPDNVVVNNVNDLSSAVFNKLTQLLIDGK